MKHPMFKNVRQLKKFLKDFNLKLSDAETDRLYNLNDYLRGREIIKLIKAKLNS